MTNWQPIETAPTGAVDDARDEVVLVRAPGFSPRVAYREAAGHWCLMGGHGGNLGWEPTHWMPLPEPTEVA
jgi:hypothetical protein